MNTSQRTAERVARLFASEEHDVGVQRTEEVIRTQRGETWTVDFLGIASNTFFAFETKAGPLESGGTDQNLELSNAHSSAFSRQANLARAWAYPYRQPESNLAISTCMGMVRDMVRSGRTRPARQYLHECVDDLLRRGQFATVDALLFATDPTQDDARVLITLLTATKPASAHLKLRNGFFRNTAEALKARDLDEPGLLEGLE